MYTRAVKTFWKAALVLSGVAIFRPIAAAADAPENFQVVDGVAIYLGVMPAQILQGHPMEHPEARMHGGVPTRGHRDHVVVTLFDNTTGQRIQDAQVIGSATEIGLGSDQQNLEPMRIADSVTYGNDFDMPGNNIYHMKVQIRRPDVPGTVEVQFTHRHFDD